ncbi:D-tyrosyl-tRNA(Tyr) deacylase [Cytobacillus oceanisediminis]|uniref:D-aminoacyl-tRNA deacylase n=2 Tax=Niallia TaxID=2837506 RepID=A0A941GJ21_NIACI|nr:MULTISPECIES: D-aminoacyl-tRNA deacylase [Bacillaceae]MBQ6446937.1 D-tyrosyl-tRNA(Tyr) deacylase [Bacillus sp. (in: firmicutes)]MBZ9536587.1 D-tyrosyl-tRNA(Tyr) deacylase [Cytobacillus oceanisediminis]MCB5235674.1 D-tyrosyl-tRNA(Tyr) deacylase [Niallia circulans]NMO78603.1 D-tyrosyl-tRNA(Tyr) deacylase [Niallia alba]UTI41862.1 D-aminoacyl-tRNA deacylase [Niallia sp. RD1]
MRVVLQRSKEAKVEVDGKAVGSIEKGFVLLVGITHSDELEDVKYLAEKIAHLRVFEDENGKMNQSILDSGGAILSISQFTLYGDTRKGRRPNFMNAAKPDQAKELYDQFNILLRDQGLTVETGIFGAMMDVHLINDGPVTLILDSK